MESLKKKNNLKILMVLKQRLGIYTKSSSVLLPNAKGSITVNAIFDATNITLLGWILNYQKQEIMKHFTL